MRETSSVNKWLDGRLSVFNASSGSAVVRLNMAVNIMQECVRELRNLSIKMQTEMGAVVDIVDALILGPRRAAGAAKECVGDLRDDKNIPVASQ